MPRWWPSPLERRIALRYLRGQRGTRTTSLQTLIAVGGIAAGVTALIIVLGVMNGLRDDLRDRILIASPHLHVLTFGEDLRIDDWEIPLAKIRDIPGVVAAAPEVVAMTLLTNRAGHPEVAKVAGIEPASPTTDVTQIAGALKSGDMRVIEATDSLQAGVTLGSRLAERLNAYPGDHLRVLSPVSSRRSPVTGQFTPVFWMVEVTGIFETGMFLYDNEFMVMDREAAQRFTGLGSAVSGIAVRVTDAWEAPVVAARIQEVLGPEYRIETWQMQNSTLFSALELEKLAMGLVIFCIMIVAAFNIVGTLTMVVAFKTREIGILQAMGLPAAGIGRVFLAQGAIVGLLGTGIGLILGLAVALIVDRTGWITIDPSIYFIEHLPVHVEILDVTVVVVASVALAVLATIMPSRRASRLAPVDAIRDE
ncbi:MAG: ABC transporter permease [Gemmatimonadales bacterium]|nr:ABC transporter permease [Gemmatimonadales bacterium]